MPVRPSTRRTRNPWRYGLILVVVCLGVVVAAAAGWHFARASAAPSNGPVIIVAIDGLRADRLPAYGYSQGRTPTIDALARDGVVFEHAYSHSPLTLPAHVAMLSGQLPFETGVRAENDALRADTVFVPQLLRPLGYRAAAVVSSPSLGRAGLARGFDFFDAADGGDTNAPSGSSRPDEKTLAAARQWVDRVGSPRFLLFLQFADLSAEPVGAVATSSQRPYDEQVRHADELLGQVVKWLKGRGLYDRATILLLSAHGQGLGAHGEQGHGLLLYEDTVHVPLVVKLPRNVSHGLRVAVPVGQVDVLPTVVDLIGAPTAASSRGHSLRAFVLGQEIRVPDERQRPSMTVYGESSLGRQLFGWAELRSLTDAHYRYIQAPREELYDLVNDPGEQRNIADEQSAIVQRMRETLTSLDPAAPAATSLTGEDPKDRVETYEQYLRASSLTARGQLLEAAAAWREFLGTERSSLAGWLQLATVLVNAARYPEAMEAYGRALKLDDANADAWIGAGWALLRAGKLADARARGERAVPLAPARAHELLARIAIERTDWTEAQRQADLAQQADPSLAAVSFIKGMQFFSAAQYADALPLLEQAARPAKPGDQPITDAGVYLADTLGRLEKYAEAETAWKEEMRRSPYSVRARVSLAMLYHAERRDTEAEAQVAEMTDAIPTADSYTAAARLWMILGNKDRADDLRQQARLRFGEGPAKPRAATR